MTIARTGSAAAMALAVSLLALPALGDDDVEEWQSHAAPFDFVFDNHIDTHQETKLDKDGDGKLTTFEYSQGEILKFSAMDANKDEFITADEIAAYQGRTGPR